jgi:thiopeptide-type bacteriocin biosynthesis protein
MSHPTSPDVVPSGFFTLRTPLLPFDELLTWGDGLEAAAAGDDAACLEAAAKADRARLRQRLRAVFARPEIREALFVASPDLEERFDVWMREPDGEPGQKIERALVRYFARMAGRATPFGLFAGCAVGGVGAETRLVLAERGRYRRHTRLDMDYVVALTDALVRQPDLRPALAFRPNSSLYHANGRVRYHEVRRNGKGWTHHRVALEGSSYLDATLARARPGARLEALAAALVADDPEASAEEAAEYVGELTDNQVLVSELTPPVTGPEPVPGITARLRECAGDWSRRLEQAQAALEGIDAGGLGAAPGRYRQIARGLSELPAKVELPRLFQVDMVKPVVDATLGQAVLDEIIRGVHLLHRLARRPEKDLLSRFREAFQNRYEGREVPLVEALDEERGVGFDTLDGKGLDESSLLDGLTFPPAAANTVPWGRREAFLLGKLSEALGQGAGEMALSERDLEALVDPEPQPASPQAWGPHPPPLPDAFAVLASVAAADEAALARGEFQVLLDAATGPSGARLLGRFCHADQELQRHVEQHLRAEEALRPHALFAEVVHLPEGRMGNVLARPVLRAYEIPYLGQAGVPADRQIPITDLLVSIRGEDIVLRSARLGRRVVPRLTSAHNFYMSQGIYRFLGFLQHNGVAAALAWDWGPLREAPFLPRVVSGRLVLCRATWRLARDELRPLGDGRGAARFRAVQDWRVARHLPRWVCLADEDNELPIDLDNMLAVDTFTELVKGREHAVLVELFPGPDQLCARGPEGRFVHELVVPFIRLPHHPATPPPHHLTTSSPHHPFRRSFPPGSEWLYAKLYTGPATVDQVLRDVVRPLVEDALATGAVDRWFFIRYGDPDWHLRLRFHGEPARLHGEVLPALHAVAAPALADGRLWRLQLDTYEREVERYGGPEGIALAERLFYADSEAVLALADLFPGDARGEVRWRLALVGMDLLLADLGFDLGTRRTLLHQARDRFAAEFRADAKLRHELGSKFRTERKSLEPLLDAGGGADTRLAPGLEVLRRRSQRWRPVIAELAEGERAGLLWAPLTELAPSYLHMHANRLLRSAHRAQELVLYDFLARLYESQAARS